MEDQNSNQVKNSKPFKKWFFVLLVAVIIVIGIGIYFYILVRQNVENINSGNTNQSSAGMVVTTDDPYKGSIDAKIVIVEFSDFQCPYCYQAFPVVGELISTYGDQIKFIFRDFPDSGQHPQAQKAAEAGECAQEQEKFWEMHDKMFINQDDLSLTALKRYAEEIGLDASSFSDCLDNGKYENEVLQDFTDGYYAGVRGTPTFFVNNRRFEGVITFDDFKDIIDQLLALNP